MKQLLQRLDTGDTLLAEVPVPTASGSMLVVETRATVVSAGTERMLVEFSRANLVAKARQQPERVKQVIDKIRTDGFAPAMEAVRAKLDQPIPLGYCHAGVVVEAGPHAAFVVGDRVVTNGSHAEYARVPSTLAARIPAGVDFERAAFTPVAAIGLQGIRLAAPTLGETVVVYGLGLIGLLTVQLLRANGCRVIGIDRDAARLELAARFGALALDGGDVTVVDQVLANTGGIGADAVLLTLASAENDPIHEAAAMSRVRGRLVLVGTTGLELRRADFYKKELSLAVSCSYGPGRYDPAYEERGQDYPVGFVRWTAQRNFDAVLSLMERRSLDPLPLVTHRFAFDDAPSAYDVIAGGPPSLGVVLGYADRGASAPTAAARTVERRLQSGPARVGTVAVIGAGNFAMRTLLPALVKTGARLRTVASSGGASSGIAAEKYGFERATSDLHTVFDDPDVDTVFVLTRHDSHAVLATRALEAGKHTFVEKPLALSIEELDQVLRAAEGSGRMLMVGFNRRFAPLAQEVKGLVSQRAGPLAVAITVNAGAIPPEHWANDATAGGGRLVGEGCHFIDLARFLVGAPITGLTAVAASRRDGQGVNDVATMSLAFSDGSLASVNYLANGASNFPKERVECFFDGRTVVIENWKRLRRFGMKGSWLERSRDQDKGHEAELDRWMSAVRSGGPAPIPLEELAEVSRWAIHAQREAERR